MGPIKFWRLSRLSLWCSHVISIFLGCFPLSPSGWQHLDKLTPESGWLYGCCVGAWTILNASSWESSPHIRAPWSVMSVSHMVPCQATKIGRRKKTVLWNGWWKCHGSSWNNIKGAHIQDIPRSCFVAVNKTSFNKSVVHWRHTTALIKQNLNLLYNIIQQFHFHELKLTATEYFFSSQPRKGNRIDRPSSPAWSHRWRSSHWQGVAYHPDSHVREMKLQPVFVDKKRLYIKIS